MVPKELKFKELPGFSQEMLRAHHDVLYKGYVKKVDEIRNTLFETSLEGVNPTFSNFRELQLEKGFALNAVTLHELYFDNLGGDGIPSESVEKTIFDAFGSFKEWEEEFVACGMSSRGWVVLAINSEGNLEHYICDMHNQGGVWDAKPVLVLDVYEHAYFTDYGTNRKAYIEAFLRNIDWTVVEKRLK